MPQTECEMLFEIEEFIDREKMYLYIQVRDYAYEHRPEWVPLLQSKQIRTHLIAYTDSLRRIDKVKENCYRKYLENKEKNT